jgi:hypothetical protein
VNDPVEVGVVLVVAACSIPHCKAIPILSSIRTAVMPPCRMCGCPFIPVPRAKRMFILSRAEDPKAWKSDPADPAETSEDSKAEISEAAEEAGDVGEVGRE